MAELQPQYRNAISNIVFRLAEHDFDQLVADGIWKRGTAADLRRPIETYGATLISLPDEAFAGAELYELQDASETDVEIYLWTQEEGESDLALKVRLRESEEGVAAEIRELDVM